MSMHLIISHFYSPHLVLFGERPKPALHVSETAKLTSDGRIVPYNNNHAMLISLLQIRYFEQPDACRADLTSKMPKTQISKD